MDVKAMVSEKILEEMKKGHKEFTSLLIESASNGLPKNGKTGHCYNGTNVLCLWIARKNFGYLSNLWLTYKQAQELGGQVRKGEKSVLCAYFDKVASKGSQAENEEEAKTYLMSKPFFLFNLDQIDGLPDNIKDIEPNRDNVTIADCEAFIKNTGAVFKDDGAQMYYSPAHDFINVPKLELFKSESNFYLAKFHELTHWTGAKHRLNRIMGKKFGDSEYQAEELVAELGGALLTGHFGLIDAQLDNHVSYLQNWLLGIEDNKNAIFTAMKLAFEAYDYLVALQEQQQEKEAA